jgi:hypothetical protein
MSAQNDIAADARWFRWLEGVDPATGCVRGQLYAAAMKRGDHARARMLVQQFERARATGTLKFRVVPTTICNATRQAGLHPPADLAAVFAASTRRLHRS